MMGENQTTEAKGGKYAEVFTPAHVVFFMLMQPHFINEGEPLHDLDKTIFDPCCGQGQFGCAAVVLKMFYCLLDLPEEERPDAVLRILLSIYNMDIQEKSCKKAREHFLLTVQDAYEFFFNQRFPYMMEAAIIINNRVQCGNSFLYMLDNIPPENLVDGYYHKTKKEYRDYINSLAKRGTLGVTKEWAEQHLKKLDNQQTLF